jgi:Cu2+-exporting ATPase
MKTNKSVTVTFPVQGMSCASCAASVELMLQTQPGVQKAIVNFADESTLVEYEPTKVRPEQLKKVIQSIGYDLIIDNAISEEQREEKKEKQYRELKQNTIWAFVLSIPVVILGMFFHQGFPFGKWISMFLTLPVLVWFGKSFFINALKQLKHGAVNMDSLVALSTGIAFLFSAFNTILPQILEKQGLPADVYYEASSVIIAFILLGKTLEERAKSRTSSAIKKLMGLQPKTVKVIRGGTEQEIKIEQVIKGDLIIIRPGEKIPVDGEVMSGNTFIDESMINGEPIPTSKTNGDKVFTGTINQKGSITIEAKKVGSETLLAQIIKMVREAQGSKAPVQKLVDKIATVFVPAIIVISIITLISWLIFGGENNLSKGILAAITVLIIACPCALGLATPTAIMVGVGKGAENGILIKDAESLELAHRVNAIVLDKTGTITNGKPVVTDVVWLDKFSNQQQIEQLLYSAESISEHPLAEAIVDYYKIKDIKLIPIENFQSITGKGISFHWKENRYYIGSEKYLDEFQLFKDSRLVRAANELKSQGKTIVYLGNDKEYLVSIAIADTVKEGSMEAIRDLKNKGIEVYMLTGDNNQTAKVIADKVGLTEFKAEVLPSDKGDFIKALQQNGKIVAMAGDGINDSQALAQADVGIAMARGTDIAMDVAKMTLINSDLRHITDAINLSKATIRTIKQNLFWAFIYNLIGIPLAAGILYPINGFLLNPMIAGAAMALSSVSVVSNSLRLKGIKW